MEPQFMAPQVAAAPPVTMAPVVTTAEPVFMTAPAAEAPMPIGTTSEPVPVATNTRPPVPMATREVVMGSTHQQRVPFSVARDDTRKNVTQHQPVMSATKEIGQAVYVTGATVEEDAAPQITEVRQEQLMLGETQQQIVEIPTVQVEEVIREVPEIQVRQMVQEVPQVIQKHVEQIVEQEVHVPKIIQQERVQQQMVEQVVEVPIPMTP